MSTRRGLPALLATLLLTLLGLVCPPVARAQVEETSVSLTLAMQTPWTTIDHPVQQLSVVATNQGTSVAGDLSLSLVLGPAFRSRFDFETALLDGPSTVESETSRPFKDSLGPGQTRRFGMTFDTETIEGIASDESLVYPASVELRSSGATIASMNTVLLHFAQVPERPVLFSWWAELDAPIALDAQDQLVDPAFEASIAPGGSLGSMVSGIGNGLEAATRSVPFDLVVQPSAVDQAERMADGFLRVDGTQVAATDPDAGAAAAFVSELQTLVEDPEVQLSLTPFAAPLLPAMVRSGLTQDLNIQRNQGKRTIDAALGPRANPALTIARPPAGALDEGALEWLAASGVSTVLANADTVERPIQPDEFAPPSTATIATPLGDLALALPDPGTQSLLERPDVTADPLRAAQVVLGELAVVWKEQPVPADQPDGSETVRGLALALPSSLPSAIWEPLISRLADAPFLLPVHPQDLAIRVNPTGALEALRSPSTSAFSTTYADTLRDLRRDVFAYRSMLPLGDPTPDQLTKGLSYAEAGPYVGDEAAGQTWIDGVAAITDDAFARVTPQVQAFTLTSESGVVPIRMGDPGPTPLKVSIALRSSQFDFPDGDQRDVTLDRPNQVVTFSVVAKASGQNPILVEVQAPSGRVISEQTMVVRSTALNRVALMITGGAALMLIALWARRFLRRRTT